MKIAVFFLFVVSYCVTLEIRSLLQICLNNYRLRWRTRRLLNNRLQRLTENALPVSSSLNITTSNTFTLDSPSSILSSSSNLLYLTWSPHLLRRSLSMLVSALEISRNPAYFSVLAVSFARQPHLLHKILFAPLLCHSPMVSYRPAPTKVFDISYSIAGHLLIYRVPSVCNTPNNLNKASGTVQLRNGSGARACSFFITLPDNTRDVSFTCSSINLTTGTVTVRNRIMTFNNSPLLSCEFLGVWCGCWC